MNPNRAKLSGTVEVDDVYIGGESIDNELRAVPCNGTSRSSLKQGRGAENKVLVAVALELDGKTLGRCRMNIIADASAKSLHTFIKENVETGSHIITDGWSGYNGIEKHDYVSEIHVQKNE